MAGTLGRSVFQAVDIDELAIRVKECEVLFDEFAPRTESDDKPRLIREQIDDVLDDGLLPDAKERLV